MNAYQDIKGAPVGRKMFVAIGIDVNVNGRKYTTDPWIVWQPVEGEFTRWPHDFPPTHFAPLPEVS